MSASFYDLMKYARTGIASPSMTHYDKQKALAMCGGGFPISTITGIPPISFKSDGSALTAWSISGNMVQTGTPTPDAPIWPEETGERTANLIDLASWTNAETDTRANLQVHLQIYEGATSKGYTRADVRSTGRVSVTSPTPSGAVDKILIKHNGSSKDIVIATLTGDFGSDTPFTVSFDVNGYNPQNIGGISLSNIMLNLGSTALDYEPYGYKIPLTCAGQTVPVYLGQTQTVRRIKKVVLDGTETITEESANVYSITLSDTVISGTGISTHFEYDADVVDGQFRIDAGKAVFGYDDTQANFAAFLAAQYAEGTPVVIWYVLAEPETGIVNEPLAKIGDYADELSSTDAAVTIPTIKGSNTLSIGTTLQPSEVSITGHIKS